MRLFLSLAFLFIFGAVLGWFIELGYRNRPSVSVKGSRSQKKRLVFPGFCLEPYLPLYGIALCTLYLIASLESRISLYPPRLEKLFLVLVMAAAMTAVEFVVGIITVKYNKVNAWDYSGEWGNILGVICPKFSLIWALFSAVYYFFFHTFLSEALAFLSGNLLFSFTVGAGFGIFATDFIYSLRLGDKLKEILERRIFSSE